MDLQRLYPRPLTIAAEELIRGLDLGSRAPRERPYVVCNMVATLDGRAALDGNTASLGGDADRRLFHLLRTQADAVLLGAGTIRAEHYGRPARSEELRDLREAEGLEPQPLSVIVSSSMQLSPELPLLADPEARVLIATAAEGEIDGAAADIVYERTGDDLRLLLARLRSVHGIRSVLCEGGPTLNAHLLAAGAIDELFQTLTPQITGGQAPTIVSGRQLATPTGAELVWLHEAEGALFARWRLNP